MESVWGMPGFLPIQGAIVAMVFFVIALIRIPRSQSSRARVLWTAVAIGTFLYVLSWALWLARDLAAV